LPLLFYAGSRHVYSIFEPYSTNIPYCASRRVDQDSAGRHPRSGPRHDAARHARSQTRAAVVGQTLFFSGKAAWLRTPRKRPRSTSTGPCRGSYADPAARQPAL